MPPSRSSAESLRLGLPKGRMQEGVLRLLSDAGMSVSMGPRVYRPSIDLGGVEVKLLKPQNIIEMLDLGTRDIGFAGADWVAELGVELVELLDTRMDSIRLVAAAPQELLVDGSLPAGPLVVASEYEQLTRRWVEQRRLQARVIRSYGATEVFPPEDSDLIVDNTATGATLAANDLVIVDELMRSTTRLYASREAMESPQRRQGIERLVLLLQSVLEARQRVMLEVNVPAERLEQVIAALPCMREPTVSALHRGAGYAVKAAVPKAQLSAIIPELKARGGMDIVISNTSQIVP